MFFGLILQFTFSVKSFPSRLSDHSTFIKNDESNCFTNRSFSSSFSSNSAICIIQCQFNSIKSQFDGGAIVIKLTSIYGVKNFIDRCIFTKCQSTNGGAIYFEIEKNFSTHIENSEFKKNKADSISMNPSGGAIYASSTIRNNFTIKNCTFNQNYAVFYGGSIYFSNLTFLIEDCIFNSNKLHRIGYSYGGALHAQESNGTIINSNFTSNKVQVSSLYSPYGGAVSISSSIGSFYKCNFVKNGAYRTESTNYKDASIGGAISFYNALISKIDNFCKSIIDCRFVSNEAISDGLYSNGGAIFIQNKFDLNNTISNSLFYNNSAYSYLSSAYAGAISLHVSNLIYTLFAVFDHCIFVKNLAHSHSSPDGRLIHESAEGGAIATIRSHCFFKNCLFENNLAEGILNLDILKDSSQMPASHGGAISLTTSKSFFSDCNFSNNTGIVNSTLYISSGMGGAIYAVATDVEMQKSIFENNKIIVLGSIFDTNSNIKGGACYFGDKNSIISDCIFINNSVNLTIFENSTNYTAVVYGGALFMFQNFHILNCTNCIFTKNMAYVSCCKDKEFCGAVYLVNGNLINCTFEDNLAFNGCDIMYDQNTKSKLRIIRCNFLHNNNNSINSLIYCNINYNESASNVFTENRIFANMQVNVFDGEIVPGIFEVFKLKAKNNCISPFENDYYKTDKFMIYNENGMECLNFDSVFESSCNEHILSQTISFTDVFFESKTLTQTLPLPINDNKSKGNKKKIIILIASIAALLVIITLIIIVLVVLKIKRKTRQEDIVDPLVDNPL